MTQEGMGTLVKIGVNSIAELTDIGGINPTVNMLDATTYSSGGWDESKPGMKSGGEVSLEMNFHPADTNGQKAIIDAFNNKTKLAISIILPAEFGFETNFDAYVSEYSVTPPKDDKVSFGTTLKITGAVTSTTTASTGLSGLSLTGTAGTLTPTFANDKYYYSFSGVTATSVTVTATAASHTLKLYIDGVYSQDLTSGSASAAIAMASIGSKKLTILANESGKTQKIYEVIVVKTA